MAGLTLANVFFATDAKNTKNHAILLGRGQLPDTRQ
jgi:hypothetical protein